MVRVRVTLNDSDKILADSTATKVLEGNHYFPHDDLFMEFFKKSTTTTICPWKGTASYYDVEIPEKDVVKDVAWYYLITKGENAKHIENYVAFIKNKVVIEVLDEADDETSG